ncbi:MAG: ABC transporter permease [Actinobacteria bacterium]|nr:ABC transporter permease [Actinomycetota bacterium]
MRRYVLRRVAIMPLLLLGIVTMVFAVTRLTPANPLVTIVGERNLGNRVVVDAAKRRWGLDRSVPVQYERYVANLTRGDLGTSFRTRQSVGRDLSDRLPATLELTLAALVFGLVSGVGLGIVAARRRDGWIDHLSRLFALVGSSMPAFWAGLLLLYVFYSRLGWLPGPGRLDPRAVTPLRRTGFYTVDSLLAGDWNTFWASVRHLAMPAFVLGWGITGIVSRLTRASLLDELGADYVRTARAMGISERRVVAGHALPNALLPTITIAGFSFAFLITGAVLVETVFSWNGVGSYAVDAARSLDYPAIMGVSLLGGIAFLLTNLLTDLTYALIDPRIRLS